MDQTKKKAAEKTPMSRKKAITLLICAAAVVLIAVGVLVGTMVLGEQRTPAAALKRYYEGMYLTANLEDMANCIEASKQEQFRLAYTLGGTTNMASSYVAEMVNKIGGNGSLTVKILDTQEKSSATLRKLRTTYPAIEDYAHTDFLLRFTGDKGERALQGAATLIKLGGRWYLPDYQVVVGAASEQ
ncbi:MAG: hypothetical protein EOM69_11395 [Clostridia bacterium]|nr:hypothetical protein [Clostridia bacterium]